MLGKSRIVFSFLGIEILLMALCVSASATGYDIQARIDPTTRTIQGYEDVTCAPTSDHAYFLLIANLGREENPYLSDRQDDATYPSGFDPASTDIAKVELLQSDSTVAVSFRMLAIPPVLQTYSLDGTAFVIDLPSAGPVKLRIHFTTHVPRLTTGDQGIDQGVLTWRFGWAPIMLPSQIEWTDDGETIAAPSDDFPFEFPAADYAAELTVPADLTLACGADHCELVPAAAPPGAGDPDTASAADNAPTDETTASDDQTFRVWNDAPTRTIAIAASASYERFSLDELSTPIDVYYLPGQDETARLFATYARDIIRDYEKEYGPYSRARLVIVENPNENGISMAADGIVWLSDVFFTHRNVTLPGILNRLSEFVLAHEIAHQWWGIGVGVDMNAENWLSEGMAQYLAVTYFEKKYGEFGPNLFGITGNGILENLVASQFGFMNLREHEIELPYIQQVERGFDEAVIKPQVDVKYDNATVARLYDKGYLVARAIAAAIGSDTFAAGLRDATDQFMHKEITVNDLEKVLEQQSGRSLDGIFSAWLESETTVDYGVEITSRRHDETGYETKVHVTRDGGTEQPVIVEALLPSGESVRETWDGSANEATISFTTTERVSRVTIDPDHFLPDRDRLNNNDPVKFVTISNMNEFPLDAYVLHPDPTSKGVSLTYLDRIRLTVAENNIAADVYQGRDQHLFLSATLYDGDVAGKVGYTHTVFSPLPTGSAGTFWAATETITVSGNRVLSAQGTVDYLHLAFSTLSTIDTSSATTVQIDLTPAGAGRISLSAFDEVRLFPRIYFQGTVVMGASFGSLPQPLLFNLSELVSFGHMVQGKWVPSAFPGRNKLYARMAIELPDNANDPYNLLNVMMLDHARMRLFVACGTSWTSFDEFGKTIPNVEAGIEGVFDLSALGGLLPLQALVGYAAPIVGGAGMGVFYFGFSL